MKGQQLQSINSSLADSHTFKCKDCWVDLSAGFSLQLHDLGIVISGYNVGAIEIFFIGF